MDATQERAPLCEDSYLTQDSFNEGSQGLTGLLARSDVLGDALGDEEMHQESQAAGRSDGMLPSQAAASSSSGSRLRPDAPVFVPSAFGAQLVQTHSAGAAASSSHGSSSDVLLPVVQRRIRCRGKQSPMAGRACKRLRGEPSEDAESESGAPAVAVRERAGQPAGEAAGQMDGQPAGSEVSEEDWKRRREKRESAVAGIKATDEYRAYSASRELGELLALEAPSTPSATDRSISKRSWESMVREWRISVKRWGPSSDA